MSYQPSEDPISSQGKIPIGFTEFILLSFVVIVFLCGIFLLIVKSIVNNDWDILGNFGDFFGSVNTVVSGMAFAGIIYTIFLQRTELALQRSQIERSVKEQQEAIRATYISNAMRLQPTTNNIVTYLARLRDQEGPLTRDIFEGEPWFEILMGVDPEARESFLRCLDDGRLSEAYKKMIRYLTGVEVAKGG